MKSLRFSVLALSVAALLDGCSHSANNAAGSASVSRAASASKQARDAKGADPDMVSAVNLTGSSTNLVSMQFKLAARPHLTTPLQVTLQLMPAADTQIERLQLSVQPGEGLLLQSDRTAEFTDVRPNTPVQQQVTVVPQQNGLLSLSATILVDADGQSLTRTYSIPLIVADSHG
jgi:hypothetical protein